MPLSTIGTNQLGTGSNTDSIRLPSGTTAQRPSSPVAGMMRVNTTLNQTEVYNGSAWVGIDLPSLSATGGTITRDGLFTIHTFTSNGTFTLNRAGAVDCLIIAGGGGGGSGVNGSSYYSGGGGAGGVVYKQGFATAAGALPVVIGSGGSVNSSGVNSSFNSLIALGGGSAGGVAGGSSGGANHGQGPAVSGATQPSSASGGFGNAGGEDTYSSPAYGTGGGGGAGGAGGAGTSSSGGNGGAGKAFDISGSSVTYASGGAGGAWNSSYGSAVAGGGGAVNTAGTANTGGGGGANAAGGSGIVIIRYFNGGE